MKKIHSMKDTFVRQNALLLSCNMFPFMKIIHPLLIVKIITCQLRMYISFAMRYTLYEISNVLLVCIVTMEMDTQKKEVSEL